MSSTRHEGIHVNSIAASRPALVAALGAVTVSSLVLGAASPAEAATLKQKALKVAASKKGAPYKYGAAGPHSFDCSGLMQFAYKQVGKKIPRVAQAQYNSSKKISWKSRQKGDLVAIGTSKKNIVHIGMFAGVRSGKSWYWHSPKPGQTVRLSPIKDSLWKGAHAYYGQVNTKGKGK
ncbi:C40 family peptidase [Streptomyces sp. NPDC018055]|uniref:C40 family peptidase n=1 Tax=Streptomyces sp. NPDC018055 TaxID=3365038 RepID=UPI00378B1202